MLNLKIILGLLSALVICVSGYELYISDSALCCNGKVIPVPVTGDVNNYGCCYNDERTSATIYKYYAQACCDGKVLDKPDEDSYIYFCCGGQLYNYNSQKCCRNTIYEKNEGYDDCCGDQLYNPNEKFCCSSWGENGIDTNTLYDYNYNQTDCCNGVAYNVHEQFCCDGQVQPKPDSFDADAYVYCCDGIPYDNNKQACCSDWGEKDGISILNFSQVLDIEGNRKHCCGMQLYDYKTEVCCTNNDTIVPRPAVAHTYHLDCCGGQVVVDHGTQTCLNGKLVDREDRYQGVCGDEFYDTRFETCCNGHKFLDSSDKACCRSSGEIYNPENQICCQSEVVQKSEVDIPSGFNFCC